MDGLTLAANLRSDTSLQYLPAESLPRSLAAHPRREPSMPAPPAASPRCRPALIGGGGVGPCRCGADAAAASPSASLRPFYTARLVDQYTLHTPVRHCPVHAEEGCGQPGFRPPLPHSSDGQVCLPTPAQCSGLLSRAKPRLQEARHPPSALRARLVDGGVEGRQQRRVLRHHRVAGQEDRPNHPL